MANKTIPEFTPALTSATVADADTLPIYDASATSPRTRHITIANLRIAMAAAGGNTVPGAPTIGTATATGPTTASVVYAAPASNGGVMITSYTATSSPGGHTGTLSQAGSGTITVTGLTASTAYTFTVTATNPIGTSPASAASNSITTSGSATVPGAPTSVTATATGPTTATVAYTQPGSNGGATITSYTATSSPGGITGVLNQAGSGTIFVTGLTAGTAYTFTVTATNSVGTSIPSAASNSITTFAVPGAPTIGTATQTGSTTATVAFTAPASNGGAVITSYAATSSPAGGTGTLSQAGSGTINVTGLTASTAYTFTVRATNSVGQGAASAASNSITTAAGSGSLPTGATVVLDARLLTYFDGTLIDGTSNKWNDTSGNANHGIAATAIQRPVVKVDTSESGSARTVLFADADGGDPDEATNAYDRITLTTPVVLATTFSAFWKVKTTKRAGYLGAPSNLNAFMPAIGSADATIDAVVTDGEITDATITAAGVYHTAPTGIWLNGGEDLGGNFTTTINGSGAIATVTNGGTLTGYDGTVTAQLSHPGRARLLYGLSTLITGTNLPTDLADGSFHNIEVHRDGANLVEFFVDGVARGTGTNAESLTLARLMVFTALNAEAFVLYNGARKTGADLTAIRDYLG